MIRHVVLFKFKPDFPPEDLAAWRAGLDRMRGGIPGMTSLTHGPDVMRADRSYDYAIVADFEHLADIEVYNTHPLHEPLKAYSFPNCESILSVDLVLDPHIIGANND